MSQTVSPAAQRPDGLARVGRVWELPRSTVYAGRDRLAQGSPPCRRRGPKPRWPDADLLGHIRAVLARSPFLGEGHRKVWARLRGAGGRTSQARGLRLMRTAGLLAPSRVGPPRGPAVHDGTIIPDRPAVMGGTDLPTSVTVQEGTATIFVTVDHYTAECLGLHAAKVGTRFEALAPLRQGVRAVFGTYAQGCAQGLQVRHDHGSQYMSDGFQAELRCLGIESSPAFVRAPEGNGCAERFIRTLKEQLRWVQTFATVEDLRQALLSFTTRYNRAWLLERHGHQPPAALRAAHAAALRRAA